MSDGVPVNVVQRVKGHQQASTTLNRYTNTSDDYHQHVRAPCHPLAVVLHRGDEGTRTLNPRIAKARIVTRRELEVCLYTVSKFLSVIACSCP